MSEGQKGTGPGSYKRKDDDSMFPFGQPIDAPEDLLENLPEGVTPQIAAETFVSGHRDGYEGKTHHIFEAAGLQQLYDRGYAQGEKEKKYRKELRSRAGAGPSGGGQEEKAAPAEPAPHFLRERAGKVLSKVRETADSLEVTNYCLAAIVGIELLRLREHK